MRLAIDWDDVIHDRDSRPKGKKLGLPYPNVDGILEDLIQDGHEVIIFTVVASNSSGKKAVEDWLEYFDIPYTRVTAVKEDADVYVDNKAVRHTSWRSTIKELNRLGFDLDEVD
jgi:hypothetical protein